MLYKKTISSTMWSFLQLFMKDKMLKDFNLTDLTSLSLQIGHRQCRSISLSSNTDFIKEDLLEDLEDKYSATFASICNCGMFVVIGGIKVNFLVSKYQSLKPIKTENGLRLVSLEEIGAIKLANIYRSGENLSDFVDMYFLLEHYPLKNYIETYQNKYEGNPLMVLSDWLYHRKMHEKAEMTLLNGKKIQMESIKERIKEAVINPEHKFEEKANHNKMI